MAVRCSECGGATTWDDDAASAICTSCGTLTDPSQSILSSQAEQEQPYNPSVPATGLWNPAAPATLKSFRTGPNWNLAGQATKEARDRKNSFAIAEFINDLAHSLNAPGLSPRATHLHAQAMQAGRFRWGRKAKLVAGACLALALREHRRPDALHDITFLLDEPFPALTRTLAAVVSTLNLSCTPADPSIHIPSLQTHLGSTLAGAKHDLPPALVAQLKPVSLRAAANTSTALCALLARLGPNHRVNSLPGPPTGCALFLLGLESEARAPLTGIGDLAAHLATRCHSSRSVVMERYKLIQDEVARMIDKVPWLSKHEPKKGRAKLAKRAVVARGLADVVLFQNEIWSRAVRPSVVLETSDGEEDEGEGEDVAADGSRSLSPTRPPSEEQTAHSSRKRRKTKHNPLHDAAAFLVDPLSAPLPPSAPAKPSRPTFPSTPPTTPAPPTPPTISTYFPLTSYLLALPSGAALASRPPTRLQLLLASRGGREEGIADDELFGEGEMEGLFRSEEQVGELRVRFGWREGDGGADGEEGEGGDGCVGPLGEPVGKRQRRQTQKDTRQDGRAGREGEGGPKKSRVNLEALAKFLENPTDEKDDAGYGYDEALLGLEPFDEDEDDIDEGGGLGERDENEFGVSSYSYAEPRTPPPPHLGLGSNGDSEVVLEEWRPLSLSPEVGRGFRGGAARDYDEEYD